MKHTSYWTTIAITAICSLEGAFFPGVTAILSIKDFKANMGSTSNKINAIELPLTKIDKQEDNVISSENSFSLRSIVSSLLRGGDVTTHYSSFATPKYEFGTRVSSQPISGNNYGNHFQTDQYVPPGLLERYHRVTNSNKEAQQRLVDTLQWRAENEMDEILDTPHPNFEIIKKYYPHAIHLPGSHGEPVYYESPGKINLNALKKENGLSLDNLIRHYALVTEFLWRDVSRYGNDSPRSKSITVLDLEGTRLRDFAGEVVTFVKQASAFCSLHYPEISGIIFILNPPSFFRVVWRVVKPMLDSSTLDRIRVVDSLDQGAIRDALMERIPVENIPREYGGSSNIPLGYGPDEQRLKQMMDRNNDMARRASLGYSRNAMDF